MDLIILIVNWNTSELLRKCIGSIYASETKLSFEIIVIDNGSTDDSIDVITACFPSVHLIWNNENVGFARANNQGLSAASGRYFLLLNSDTIVLPNALNRLVEVADMNPEVGIIGPKLLNMDGTLQKSWASFPTFWSELIGKNFRRRRTVVNSQFAYEVDWIMGACMLVRSEVVTDVGMLDEDYFMYSEETDWCYRTKRKGWKVWYLSDSEIYHLGGGSANRSNLTQLVLLYRSKILFFRKHYGNYQAILLRYGLALANFLGLIRRAIFRIGKDRNAVRKRLAAQSRLILCLLMDRYPEIDKQTSK